MKAQNILLSLSIYFNYLGINYSQTAITSCNCQPEKVEINFNDCSLNDFDVFIEGGTPGGPASIINTGFSGCGVRVTRPALIISKNANFSFGTYSVKARAASSIANQGMSMFAKDIATAALGVGVQPKNTDDEGWGIVVNGKIVGGGGRRPTPVSFPNWYEMKVRVTPDSLLFWLDNTLMYETGDNRMNNFPKCGKIILGAFSSSEYDDFKYEPYYDTTEIKVVSINKTICANSSFEGYTTEGIFTDFFGSDSICDSIRILDLKIGPQEINDIEYTLCQGESYLGYSQTGIYRDTFQAATGCDSVRILNLSVNPTFQNTITQNICQGEIYLGYNQPGTYRDTFQTASGCDSIRILTLSVNSSFENNINQNICQGEIYLGYDQTGIYRDTFQTASGCDSIRILNLSVNSTFQNNINQNICQGEIYFGYDQSGIYRDTFQTASGCDSVRILNLTVNSTFENIINQTICEGENYLGYSQSGIYRDTFQSFLGCDSIQIINLKVDSVEFKAGFLGKDIIICDNSEYILRSPSENTIWSNGITAKSIKLEDDALVVAKIINENGCEITDSINVTFKKKYYLPNSFSPNDDGINDCYYPILSNDLQISDFEIKIYDRWGSMVFFSKDIQNCWDGKIRGEMSNSTTFLAEIRYIDEDCGEIIIAQNLILVR